RQQVGKNGRNRDQQNRREQILERQPKHRRQASRLQHLSGPIANHRVMSHQNDTMVPLTAPILHADGAARARPRMLFVRESMSGAGAERIVIHLVKHLNRDEFDARVGLLWPHGDYLGQLPGGELIVTRLGHGWIPYRDQPPWWQLLPSLALVPLQQRDLVRRFRPHIVVTATKSMNIAGRFSLALAGRSSLRWVAREGNNTGAMIDNESPTGVL